MLLSMTGYGKAVATYKEKKIHVEVRALNSKNFDCQTRIAPIYREREMRMLESDFDKAVKRLKNMKDDIIL